MNIIYDIWAYWKGRQVWSVVLSTGAGAAWLHFSVSTPVLTQPHLSASLYDILPHLQDFNQGVELHTLLNWIENSAWTLVHTSEAAISQSACNHTFIFQKATFMGR